MARSNSFIEIPVNRHFLQLCVITNKKGEKFAVFDDFIKIDVFEHLKILCDEFGKN